MHLRQLPIFLIAALSAASPAGAETHMQICTKALEDAYPDAKFITTAPTKEALKSEDFVRGHGVDPADFLGLIHNDAVNGHFIADYVAARENFTPEKQRDYADYNVVRVYSDADTFRKYQNQMSVKNPASPAMQLGYNGARSVRVDSIAPGSVNATAYGEESRAYILKLHFENKTLAGIKAYDKTASIAFRYAKLGLNTVDRCLNPAGFQVFGYFYID